MDRFKFYTINDLSLNFAYDRINELLENIEFDEDILLIDVLEYYNVYRLVENIKEKDTNHNFVDEQKQKDIKSFIAKYFNKKNKSNIIQDFNSFNKNVKDDNENRERLIQYFDDYLVCFEKYKLHNKIEEGDFEKILELESIPFYHYLVSPYFSSKYPEQIKKVFLLIPSNFELVISGFTDRGKQYNLPGSIQSDEYSQLCIDYIESDCVNLSYLEMVLNGIKGINKYFKLTPNIRFRAKNRYQEEMNRLRLMESTTYYNTVLEIHTKYTEYISSHSTYKALIDEDWLKKNCDPYSLLSYFRSVNFFLVDQFYLGLCSYPNCEMDIFEKTFGTRTKRNYEAGAHFYNKNALLLSFIHHYQEFLRSDLDTSLELVLQYFFNDYIFETYGVKFLKLEFPIEQMSIKKRTLDLFVLEESLRKQWYLFVEDGEVSAELFSLLSETPEIQELRSLIKDKHFYINKKDNNQERIMYLLFSDQAPITYVSEEKHANNFTNLIRNNNVRLDDYKNSSTYVEFLIDNDVVSNDREYLYFNYDQNLKIFRYSDIYCYDSISKLSLLSGINDHWKQTLDQVIDDMVNDNILTGVSTLYTQKEADYLNYIINDSKFDNSLGIRNKYGHGSILEDNLNDYYYSLLVLVMFALKIDQELIYHSNNK